MTKRVVFYRVGRGFVQSIAEIGGQTPIRESNNPAFWNLDIPETKLPKLRKFLTSEKPPFHTAYLPACRRTKEKILLGPLYDAEQLSIKKAQRPATIPVDVE